MKKILKWAMGLLMILWLLPAAQAVTLVWDGNTEADLAGYKVYAAAGSTAPVMINVGLTNVYVLNGLTDGLTYTFYVTAYNTAGLESDPSASISYTPGLGVPPMLVIVSNHAQAAGTNWVIDLAWQASPAVYEVSGYYYRVVQNGVTNAPVLTTNTAIRLTIPSISPSFVHLWASNYVGNATPAVAPYSQPGRVKNVRKVLS